MNKSDPSVCYICNDVFAVKNLITINRQKVCINCKNTYLQQLREGAGQQKDIPANFYPYCPKCNELATDLKYPKPVFKCQHCDELIRFTQMDRMSAYSITAFLMIILIGICFGILKVFHAMDMSDTFLTRYMIIVIILCPTISISTVYFFNKRIKKYHLFD